MKQQNKRLLSHLDETTIDCVLETGYLEIQNDSEISEIVEKVVRSNIDSLALSIATHASKQTLQKIILAEFVVTWVMLLQSKIGFMELVYPQLIFQYFPEGQSIDFLEVTLNILFAT